MADADQEAEVERLRPREHERQEEREREERDTRREDRADVIVRTRGWRPAGTPSRFGRLRRGGLATSAEEIRLRVEPGGRDICDTAVRWSEDELVVVEVPLAHHGPREERVRQDVGRPDVVQVREREDEEQQSPHEPPPGPDARAHASSATTYERTARAPAARSAPVAAASVAPVVATSSTSATRAPRSAPASAT